MSGIAVNTGNTAVINGVIAISGTITGTINPTIPNLEEKNATASTSAAVEVTPSDGYDGMSKVTIARVRLQNKTVELSSTYETINAGESYAGLGSVTVSVPLETKTVTPSISQQLITADTGLGLSSVTVNATPLQDKTVTPGATQQVVLPDSGFLGLSSCTVEAGGGGGGVLNTGINDELSLYSYYGNTGIDEIVCPAVATVNGSAFEASAFKTIRFTNTGNLYIDNGAFKNSGLKDLYIHSSTVASLGSSYAFQGVTGLTIHVPQELLASYQADSMWSAVNCTWVAIS